MDFFDCPDRRCTESHKWNKYHHDVLPMWVADMDFVSPQPVIDALQERAAHGVFGYPVYTAELRETVIEWIANHYAWNVQPEHLVFLPGVVQGFNLACHTVAEQPGTVIVQPPIYPPMLSAPKNAGLKRVDAPLRQASAGQYQVDWDEFRFAFESGPRLFLLCNPHNPTGRVFRRYELERMAEICLNAGVPICSDEIHCDLVFPGHRHIPIASLHDEIAQKTITLIAPSKTFNIAGLHFSVAVIPDKKLRSRFLHSGKGLISKVNIMGLAAAEAAYRQGEEWLAELLQTLEQNRDFVDEFVRTRLPGVKMTLPEATYLAWLDCRDLQLPKDPYTFFLEDAGVALNNGLDFGPGGQGFVRLNFGCPQKRLREALERMEAALQQVVTVNLVNVDHEK